MRKLNDDSLLSVYDEGELRAVYETDGTVDDIRAALENFGYFDEYDENDWENGVCGYRSLEEIAEAIAKSGEFEDSDEGGDIFIGLGDHRP